MPEDHPHQHFHDQFARWEGMGRGGLPVAEAPVALEPPYSPFPGYRIPEPAVHDDGNRPGLFSRLFETSARRPNPQAAPVPAEPELAFTPLPREDGVREITITLPHDFKPERGADAALLSQLSRCAEPLSFEILADHTAVVAQFTASAFDEPNVTGTLRAYFPEAIFVSRDDVFTSMIERSDCEAFHILECGLGREFLVPLAAPPSDTLVGFVGALGELDEGQFGMYQFLFHPARHPWGEAGARVMRREDGRPLPWIDGEILKASEEKFAAPLYAVVVRFCGGSHDEDSMWHLMMRLASPFQHFAGAKSNFLVPLSNGDYDPDEHIRDLYYRRTRRAGLLLSASELRGLVHMPTGAVRTGRLSRQIRHSRAAPAAVRAGEGLFLGVNEHHGASADVHLTDEQRGRHVHIIGASGTGKSTLLLRMIGDDIRAGRGVGVLDPHGDLIDALLAVIPDHRVDDVVLLDPSDTTASVAFNILTARSETEKTLLASDLVSVFQRLSTSWGDQMNIILRNAILAFLESPRGGTLSDMRRFLVDKGYRLAYAATIADPDIRYYWEKTFDTFASKTSVGAVVTRLEDLLAPKPVRYIVSQDESTLDFADIMDSGKIFLCRLSQGLIGKENSHLFGSLIVAKIQQTAMSRQRMETGRRRHFWLYVDEFQNFITPSMAEILSEARKYRLGLVLAHQSLSQMQRGSEVSDAVLANTNVRIVFRVGDADAKVLAGGFGSFDAADIQSLERGHALCRVERADHDFNLYSPLPDPPDPAIAAARSAQVTEASRRKYAIDRATVETRLRAKLGISEATPHAPPAEAPPAPPSSPPSEPLSESPSDSPSVIILPPREVSPITANSDAPSPAVEPSAAPSGLPGKGGAEHRELQQFVKETANKHGYRATIEEPIGDGKSIDVALETDDHAIACEITIETPGAKELGNIQKAIDAGFDKIIVICPNPRKRKGLSAAIETQFGSNSVPVVCIPPSELENQLRQTPPEAALQAETEHAPPPAANKKQRGYAVKREFADGTQHQPLSESKAMEILAKIMRPKKNEQD